MKEKELYDLAGTCIEAAECVSKAVKDGETVQSLGILNTIRGAAQYILRELEKSAYEAKVSKLYCQNIIASAEKSAQNIGQNQARLDFDILPFCRELQFNLELELKLISLAEFRARQESVVEHSRDAGNKNYRYKVSIVLLAYNKLEYTQKAIESIYKYTNFTKHNVELITVNNGSSDGTEAYFESLPNEKKMNMVCNILGINAYRHIIEGKYIVGFSNDVIATPNWLDNLLRCIESDQNIIWAVPTCNEDAISNQQGVKVTYENSFQGIDEMQLFAKAYNHSNANKWEERSVLMPFVNIRRNFDSYVYVTDPAYTQLEFCDDDLSTLYRRHGLKQVLAKDTFLHHFGSITLKAGQQQNSSLENMRKVFYDKWGVDAWESRQSFLGLEGQLPVCAGTSPLSVLMLEPRFGETFLQIKNHYWKKGIAIGCSMALLTDARYEADATGMFDKAIVADSLMAGLDSIIMPANIISAGRFLGDLRQEHIIKFLEKLYSKLAPGGMILLPVLNYQSMGVVLSMLMVGGIETYDSDANEFSGYSLGVLQDKLTQHEFLSNFELSMTQLCAEPQRNLISTFLTLIDMKIRKLSDEDKTRFAANLSLQSGFLKIYKTC